MPYYGTTGSYPNYVPNSVAAPYGSVGSFNNTNYAVSNNGMPTSIALVKGEDGAANYPVASGNTVLLIDFESNKFWLKTNVGMSQSMRVFSFVENTPKIEPQNTDYVSKKEFDDLKSYLENQFQGLRSQMHKMKKPKEE